MSVHDETFTLTLDDIKVETADGPFQVNHWTLQPGQHWLLAGPSGSGKSLFCQLLTKEVARWQGTIEGLPARCAGLSLESQQRWTAHERAQFDDTDDPLRAQQGRPVRELLQEIDSDAARCEQMMAALGLSQLADKGLFLLSTGETRRLLLARALLTRPQLLILDEPFQGLDAPSQQWLRETLSQWADTVTLLLVVSHPDHIPDCMTHVAVFDQLSLHEQHASDAHSLRLLWQQAQQLDDEQAAELPAAMAQQPQWQPATGEPLIRLRHINVSYPDKQVLNDFNWQLMPGENWQISGPNGCGKTTLLNLISGDHPQSYNNDIYLFGMQRGQGESIWDIKKHLGLVSAALHLAYRAPGTALSVVLSGYFDSIGLYQQPTSAQQQLAQAWLQFLKMSHLAQRPFNQLSYGQQRLCLIARALIKRPPVLLLDEPLQGLDWFNRKLVLAALDRIALSGLCQLIYVTHHADEALSCINGRIEFVSQGDDQYQPVLKR